MSEAPGQVFLPNAATLAAQGGYPTLRPRDAATLLLLRRDEGKVQVLSGRRSDRHKFMPGVYVFPGGRRDPTDSRILVSGSLAETIALKLAYKSGARMTPARMRALAVAAIRETYEEAGLAIGLPHGKLKAALPSRRISARCGSSGAPSRLRAARGVSTHASSRCLPMK